ncbi:hypothetical protein P170DRAFT_426690 [Aspergillus steynii IBT 23096]|uniref:Uncharacterized protein n=1 Tax=Aspergillus steynii IBT 23096 TaxID=1392250 RepID=A0A2I2GAB9_9EURO|nr:uncharacterized protein P170DRAFT_426690 [Aspergillus steynii IBT 23096]PLB49824.1 hypothetical protein P170DRAFT_426690 [Aspergillus steynii IBT 23096]
MPDQSQEPHQSFMDKMFHHHQTRQNQERQQQQPQQQGQSQMQDPEKHESEMDKFKDYIEEDEEMEREQGSYGGLMENVNQLTREVHATWECPSTTVSNTR